eukprot:TRINITY_DN9553_c0_g1_i15.p1 TRINITY_DN9553_c0_g1~~TRINITY_DN9553_c0_g1_i15.p1  ORF type:complete len:322 (+),score=105.95 TRINITY_DN9553_c0_g1_i15:107-967(+)
MALEEKVVKAATAALVRRGKGGGGAYEVLLGQAPFDNFLKAEQHSDTVPQMRYPGEFRIPGGCIEEGESPAEAALREVEEELGVSHGEAKARLFSVRRTAVVRGRRHLMYNFVVHCDENPWINDLCSEQINAWLAEKKQRFDTALSTNDYWGMTFEEKMDVSPEVVMAEWWDTGAACRVLASSRGESAYGFPEPHSTQLFEKHGLCPKEVVKSWRAFGERQERGGEHLFWNDYQHAQMAQRGIKGRDPMYQTLTVMSGLADLPLKPSLEEVCSHEKVAERSNVDEW